LLPSVSRVFDTPLGSVGSLHPASAQCNSCGPWVQDASYVEWTDALGGIYLDVESYSGGDSPNSWGYTDYGSVYVPGATVSPYVDCSCNSSSGATYSGTWEYWAENPIEDLGSEWSAPLNWTIYTPYVSLSACTGPSCCPSDNPTNTAWYEEYYTDYEEYLEFWVY
jgi:hypothetical protein